MNRQILLVVVVGALIIALTVWLMYPTASTVPRIELSKAKYMHCPNCGRETKFDPKRIDAGCNRCGEEYQLVPTAESIAEGGSLPSPYARMIAPILLELNILLVVMLCLTRWKHAFARSEVVQYRHTRCPTCKRRLRFSAQKVGQQGRCPRCKVELVFPEGELAEEPV